MAIKINEKTGKGLVVKAPMTGYAKEVTGCVDTVFAGEVVGKGVFLIPYEGKVYSPIDGEVSMVAELGHALTILADNGAQVLVHVGIDTVELDGGPFEMKVAKGDKVKTGDLLIEFDMDAIEASNKPLETPIVITNHSQYKLNITTLGRVEAGEALFEVDKK